MNELRAQQAQMATRPMWPQAPPQQHMYAFDPSGPRPPMGEVNSQMTAPPGNEAWMEESRPLQGEARVLPGPGYIPTNQGPMPDAMYMPHQQQPTIRFRHAPNPMPAQFQPHPGAAKYSRVPDYMMPMNTRPRPPYTPIMPRGPDLVRRPLHNYHSPKPVAPTSPTSFRSRVMSVLGLNPYTNVPPGLQNQGQNLCFMNSVLQCLAHTPRLQACLSQHQRNPAATLPEESVVNVLSELLQQLAVPPSTNETAVVDSDPLRQALSGLPHSMVLHPQRVVS